MTKRVKVQCKKCLKEYTKQYDPNWSGLCQECARDEVKKRTTRAYYRK